MRKSEVQRLVGDAVKKAFGLHQTLFHGADIASPPARCEYCAEQVGPGYLELAVDENDGRGTHQVAGRFCDRKCLAKWLIERAHDEGPNEDR